MSYQPSDIVEFVKQSASEVFEGMTFAEVEQVENLSAPQTPTPDEYLVNIDLNEPVRGHFIMSFKEDFLWDYLGVNVDEDEIADRAQYMKDFAAELLNTLVGNFMARMLPPNTEFKIGIPTVAVGTFPDFNNGDVDQEIFITLTIDGMPFFCQVGWEQSDIDKIIP
ncbi:MAG: hypothetical protein Kow0037_01770 [Calditrichia bacterium]